MPVGWYICPVETVRGNSQPLIASLTDPGVALRHFDARLGKPSPPVHTDARCTWSGTYTGTELKKFEIVITRAGTRNNARARWGYVGGTIEANNLRINNPINLEDGVTATFAEASYEIGEQFAIKGAPAEDVPSGYGWAQEEIGGGLTLCLVNGADLSQIDAHGQIVSILHDAYTAADKDASLLALQDRLIDRGLTAAPIKARLVAAGLPDIDITDNTCLCDVLIAITGKASTPVKWALGGQ